MGSDACKTTRSLFSHSESVPLLLLLCPSCAAWFVIGCLHIDTKQNMLTVYDTASMKARWSFFTKLSQGPYQDDVSSIVADKNLFAVTMWCVVAVENI